MRTDESGEFWLGLIKAAIGAVVNVATSYIAATVTGQEYTWKDAAVDAALGALGALSSTISGVASGLIAIQESYLEGASLGESVSVGILSSVSTICSISNLAKIDGSIEKVIVSGVSDLVFGTGASLLSEAIAESISRKAKQKNPLKNIEKNDINNKSSWSHSLWSGDKK